VAQRRAAVLVDPVDPVIVESVVLTPMASFVHALRVVSKEIGEFAGRIEEIFLAPRDETRDLQEPKDPEDKVQTLEQERLDSPDWILKIGEGGQIWGA